MSSVNRGGAAELRRRIASGDILIAPGAADAMSARLIEQTGFEALYATGAGIANSMLGLPDIGLATMTELVEQIRRMAAVTSIPIIADADTGFGNVVNVHRAVQEYERAGVAGIQLEDQVFPKRCGHFDGKEIVPTHEMQDKIRSACAARLNPDTVIIARTDAIAVEGLDAAIERGNAYAAAGADVVFIEAPRAVEDIARLPALINAPMLFNMTEGAKTPLISAPDLGAMGYRIVIYPNAALRAAMLAVRRVLEALHADGTTGGVIDQLETWEQRQALVDLAGYDALERRFTTMLEPADG